MVTFISGNSVLRRRACFRAIMQQRREQYGRWRLSREPAHCTITSSFTGMRPTDAWPAQSSSSSASSTCVTTPSCPYPRSEKSRSGAGSQPVAVRMAPACTVVRCGDWLKSMASTGHFSAHLPQKVQVSRSMVRTTRPS